MDKKDAFDYENSIFKEMTNDDIKSAIKKEVEIITEHGFYHNYLKTISNPETSGVTKFSEHWKNDFAECFLYKWK